MIRLAGERTRSCANVECRLSDAYSLGGVSGPFSGAFGHWWWSHVPKSELRGFLVGLHRRLARGAVVLFVDQLLYPREGRRMDHEGNLLENRVLSDGRSFEIVKNFPSEREVREVVSGIASRVEFRTWPEGLEWSVRYVVDPAA